MLALRSSNIVDLIIWLKGVLVENSSYVQIICFFNKACVLIDWEILSFPCSVERDSDFGT